MSAGTKLFVGGIPAGNANADQVKELFTEHGCAPLEVVILPPKGSNPEARCGFVRVPEEAVASICQSLNGLNFEGYAAPLVVRPADNQARVTPPARADAGGAANAPLKLHAIGGLTTGPLGRNSAVNPNVDVAWEKQRAKAEGRWVDAAEWHDQEFFQQGETPARKFARLSTDLQDAVLAEHFYEAAAIFEIMCQLDAEAAAGVNASAAVALASRSGNAATAAPVVPAIADAPAVATATVPAAAAPRGPYSAQIDEGAWAAQIEGAFAGQIEALQQAAAAAATAATRPAGVAGDVFVGTILSFSPERHFGFIQCPELGADAFLSGTQIAQFKVGDRVAFNVTYSGKGQPHAHNLTDPPDDPANPAKRMRTDTWQLA